jgi:hypothetical protein
VYRLLDLLMMHPMVKMSLILRRPLKKVGKVPRESESCIIFIVAKRFFCFSLFFIDVNIFKIWNIYKITTIRSGSNKYQKLLKAKEMIKELLDANCCNIIYVCAASK